MTGVTGFPCGPGVVRLACGVQEIIASQPSGILEQGVGQRLRRRAQAVDQFAVLEHLVIKRRASLGDIAVCQVTQHAQTDVAEAAIGGVCQQIQRYFVGVFALTYIVNRADQRVGKATCNGALGDGGSPLPAQRQGRGLSVLSR